MANYGLSKPMMAKLDVEAGTYSGGFQCGKAVNTSVTPNNVEGSLYGDNEQVEYVNEFKDADIALAVTELPLQAASTVFGHTVEEETKNIVYNSNDSANYIGYGFCVNEQVGGVKKVTACFLPKVKFVEAADSFTTKGDAIAFSTPSLTGKASAITGGKWKEKQQFDTEEKALTWLKGKLNITSES